MSKYTKKAKNDDSVNEVKDQVDLNNQDLDLSDLEDINSTREIKKINKKSDKYSVPIEVIRYDDVEIGSLTV